MQGLNEPPGSGPLPADQAWLYGGWGSGWSREKGDAVNEALRHMGDGVVPALQRMVRYRETPMQRKLKGWVQRQTLLKFRFNSESEIHQEAAAACNLAEPAVNAQVVREWIRFLEDKETALANDPLKSAASSEAVHEAVFCFYRASQNLGPQAPEPLLQALTNRNTHVRSCAAFVLHQFVSDGKAVVPALIRSLTNDPDETVRFNAAMALGRMLPEAQTVVPALLDEVRNPASKARGVSLLALSGFTNEAAVIVPVLMNTLAAESDESIRKDINNALLRLDPEAAIGSRSK